MRASGRHGGGRCAWAWAVVLIVGGLVWAQQRVNYGHNLDNNLQQYTMRGSMGVQLDNNLRVGGSGYNGFNPSMTQGNYQVKRGVVAQRTGSSQRANRGTNLYGQQLPSSSQNMRYAADLSRREYSPPVYSEAYREAVARTGRNPNMNPVPKNPFGTPGR